MKYSEVFRKAWKNVLDDFEAGTTCIEREADLQCLLFSECMKILRENTIRPIPIHAEAPTLSPSRSTYTDLTLGLNMELLIELEPDVYDDNKDAKQALDKLNDEFQENQSVEGIFLCLTKNVENQDSLRHYLEYLPSRMQKDGFQVESRFVRHPMHEECYANSSTNSEIHCTILIWRER